MAALDYRALCKAQGGQPRLLFVAHRVEILRQAMVTYRQALRDPAFGEVLAEGRAPSSYDHLFASIQSVASADLLERFGPDYWHTEQLALENTLLSFVAMAENGLCV